MDKKQCYCIIRHAITDTEKQKVSKALQQARVDKDSDAVKFYLYQLLGQCPAR